MSIIRWQLKTIQELNVSSSSCFQIQLGLPVLKVTVELSESVKSFKEFSSVQELEVKLNRNLCELVRASLVSRELFCSRHRNCPLLYQVSIILSW